MLACRGVDCLTNREPPATIAVVAIAAGLGTEMMTSKSDVEGFLTVGQYVTTWECECVGVCMDTSNLN